MVLSSQKRIMFVQYTNQNSFVQSFKHKPEFSSSDCSSISRVEKMLQEDQVTSAPRAIKVFDQNCSLD
jgi:hypothetical protein